MIAPGNHTEAKRKSLNDLFVERTEKTRNKKGKKVSGRMVVKTRSQKASEVERAMLDVKIPPNRALDETRAGHGTEGNGNRWLTSEPIPIELPLLSPGLLMGGESGAVQNFD